ncbi:Abi family protein [Schaalia odontolytica]|uniref:Abortive infection bacteriophage resistance protein n=1 Tax=Schaalia odontolytica TaxID=1660 RepID=A0A2X0VPI2_9ACTO|nr:Abi family protein [Schaalia odontolytica]WMS26994.1 Abi family protein [Schaalia odontolytica]SPT55641.1 Abortive infection bacteriophage resistance protein [Schaalia odontolytica]
MDEHVKDPTTIDEQIRILSERGMHVDIDLAQQWLRSVSYYRLSGYWYPYREQLQSAPRTPARADTFVPGSTFSEVADLYEFDRKLRTLVHDGIERIEIALRTRVGEWIVTHGPLAHQEKNLFRPDFDHKTWLKTARRRIQRAEGNNAAIRHYTDKYEGYPFWVLAETLDFADISKLYAGLPINAQHEISRSFGFIVEPTALKGKHRKKYYTRDPLARWCEQLTVVRNVCAHHGRLFNRNLLPVSTVAFRTIDRLSPLPEGQSDKVFGALLVMGFMLHNISPGTSWARKLSNLVHDDYDQLTLRSVNEMGFSPDWASSFTHL